MVFYPNSARQFRYFREVGVNVKVFEEFVVLLRDFLSLESIFICNSEQAPCGLDKRQIYLSRDQIGDICLEDLHESSRVFSCSIVSLI